MINYVVVDDNNTHRKRVVNAIISKMMSNQIEFNIKEFDDYSPGLLNYIKDERRNTVYILDLELPSGDCIDIARYIRNDCNNWISPIIIVTAHTSLYYEVYKQRLQLLDFIGKYNSVEDGIFENIDICLRMLSIERVYRYTYKNVEHAIPVNNIDYIIREGRQTKIVTSNRNYFQNISIKDIKDDLPEYFIYSNKGVLINYKNVDKIDWNSNRVYFKDGISNYLVSRSHKKEITEYELV